MGEAKIVGLQGQPLQSEEKAAEQAENQAQDKAGQLLAILTNISVASFECGAYKAVTECTRLATLKVRDGNDRAKLIAELRAGSKDHSYYVEQHQKAEKLIRQLVEAVDDEPKEGGK